MYYETYREPDGRWAFELFHQDGTRIAHGSGYEQQRQAEAHAEELMRRTYEQQSMGLPW
ncbi:MAG: DUF1508 domain-containing protein [Halorhodospira halophila]|uniref:DUF1508 domain-containing protein n=1 Tax=Halorhodospira TaxID=85108 RepID=UPI00191475D3|nr:MULTISPECIES: DUF1508 domain-containing protein [Halorhodospira]MCC3751307.1 DUF1508 domain-containing protein [Halorhodospira halophila]MCG5528669.1 DUF1508 domain-containing protein [Halorhodospira halophila]MCG5543996.1 DUF1508 domain-containing protein [Halorhodospira sp. 9628]